VKYANAALWIFYGWALRKLHMRKRWVHEVEDQASLRMFECSLDFKPALIDDFYEDDEPIGKIEAAFERGEKVHTAPPEAVERELAHITPHKVIGGRLVKPRDFRTPRTPYRTLGCEHFTASGPLVVVSCPLCGPCRPVGTYTA
jgi:hypothetical protein